MQHEQLKLIANSPVFSSVSITPNAAEDEHGNYWPILFIQLHTLDKHVCETQAIFRMSNRPHGYRDKDEAVQEAIALFNDALITGAELGEVIQSHTIGAIHSRLLMDKKG